MEFTFLAYAQDDGIIFSYKNYTKAIKIYREGEKIKEEDYIQEEYDSKLEYMLELVNRHILILLIILDILIIYVLELPQVVLYILNAVSIVVYLIYNVIKLRGQIKSFCYERKQYHAAEHMIFNAPKKDITVQQLRNESKYANDCGSNTTIVEILNTIFIILLSNIFAYLPNGSRDILLLISKIILLVLLSHIIHIVTNYLCIKGLFNHIIQSKVIEEPTDEQLELAIYGMKRAKELERNLIRKNGNSEE